MSAHTPGPWVVRHDFKCSDGTTTVGVSAETITGGRAAVAWPCGVDIEQEQANARLISAAPDMLEACKALIAYCDKNPPMGDSLWSVQLIRKAINKAEGGAA